MWIKSKCIGEDEFVIGGYRRSDKQGRAFRSLLVGEFDEGKLIYRGRVGTGFNDETFRTLLPMLEKLQRRDSPFASTPAEAKRGAVWVDPKVVAQIAYLEKTPDGHLRHPSYLGLREDKQAKEVTIDASSAPKGRGSRVAKKTGTPKATNARGVATKAHGQRLTSPDKILWPEAGLTKLDLANYYDEFSAQLLPFVKGRPLSIVRCPEGHASECFFQKHHNPSTPDTVETVKIREKKGGSKDYLIIRNKAGLLGAAQISGLELHVWGAREDSLEKPERMVFDLDPDEDLDFSDVTTAALELRGVLDSVGLKSFPLITGGKGVHVIAPIARTREWPEVKAFCRGLAEMVAKSSPERYIAQASKAKRKGRIFIDWLRNERGATAIAPFSPRRRENAPVATPVSWKELPDLDSAASFTMKTIGARLARLRQDPWAGYAAASRQSLKAAAIAAVTSGDA
jgi:bifunctional non-homologous end joining protein LigD